MKIENVKSIKTNLTALLTTQAFKIYFYIQKRMFSPISQNKYKSLIEQNKILERDRWGVKVLETDDNRIIKTFRLKRLFSSAYFIPYALRFKWNASRLINKGIASVVVNKIVYCREEQRHVLTYTKAEGQPIKALLEKTTDNNELLKKLIVFIVKLHNKGIYFRSLHFGNIIVSPKGEFILIDISDIKFFPFKLTVQQRIRNWKHVTKYSFESSIIESYGWDMFFKEYASNSQLTSKETEVLMQGLRPKD